VIPAKLLSHERLWRVIRQEGDSAANALPREFRVGWGVSEVQEAFVTTIATIPPEYRR
jgi:hypothetical protein